MSTQQNSDRLGLAEARRTLIALVRPAASEIIDSEVSLHRITAEPVTACFASPHYRGAAMDGIAVSAAATAGASPQSPVMFVELGPSHIGDDAKIPPGCVVVDTGNPLPAWADAVIRREVIRRTERGFEVSSPVAPGRDVRAVGEDVAAGASLLPRGHRIRPYDVGALLATGNDTVCVRAKPRVGVLATGAEIIEPGIAPLAGEIIEYNSRMLAGFVAEAGGLATYLGRAEDDAGLLAARVRDAAAEFDLVCVIAGSSRGRKDFTLDAIASAGKLLFRGVAVAPGRPTGLGVVGKTPVLAIPGYPVSAVVAYRELVTPFIAATLQTYGSHEIRVDAVVRRDVASGLGVEELVRVCLAIDGKDLVAAPLPRGAGSISTLVRADGLLRIDASVEGIARDSRVEIELLRPRAEIGHAVVVAGGPHALLAELEDRCRRHGEELRFAYLGLSDLDALVALAAGEAHCALLGDAEDAGDGSGSATSISRHPKGWSGYRMTKNASEPFFLVLTARFRLSPLARAFDGWPSVAESGGFTTTSIESDDARS